MAGNVPVLVHNTPGCGPALWLAQTMRQSIFRRVPSSARTHRTIFRSANGHLPDDMPANRAIIQGAINPANLRSTTTLPDGSIIERYFEALPNGTQAWVEVRNGEITNGGLN